MTKKSMSPVFEKIWTLALNAGFAAGKAAIPDPMVVVQADPLTGKPLPGATRHVVDGGVCGFAYLTITPATSAFVRWLKKNGNGHARYGGGWEMSISGFGQSMTRKEAAAKEMARVLQDNGINASYYSRMD